MNDMHKTFHNLKKKRANRPREKLGQGGKGSSILDKKGGEQNINMKDDGQVTRPVTMEKCAADLGRWLRATSKATL